MMTSRNTMLLTLALLVLLLNGCSMLSGPTDEELISRSLVRSKAAYERQSVSGIIAENSKDYKGQYGEDIEVLREFLKEFKESGRLDGATLEIDQAKIIIDGETAIVTPLKYIGDWGEMQATAYMKKEKDGKWRFTSSRQF